MAPASVIAMFIAPVAGRLSDRIGGKYILMTGLVLFAVGMGWLALHRAAHLGLVRRSWPRSSWRASAWAARSRR